MSAVTILKCALGQENNQTKPITLSQNNSFQVQICKACPAYSPARDLHKDLLRKEVI